jgi:hypothetical protein
MTSERRMWAVREAQKNRPLLDNGTLDTFSHQRLILWNQSIAMKLTHIYAATDKIIVIEELLGVVASIRFSWSYEGKTSKNEFIY